MLCTSCGLPASGQASSSPRAKAAVADRRREQNRRAQKRFRQKHREQKANTDQDQSHLENGASNSLDNISPIAPSALAPLTPPSTMPSIGCYDETRGDAVIDYEFFLDSNNQYDETKIPDDFWIPTTKETAPFTTTALILPAEAKDCGERHTTRSSSDSVEHSEDGKASTGLTILHRAVQTGNSKVVSLLLEHNADCNLKDNAGLTPLFCAIIGGHEEVLDLLLSHGANIEHADNANWSALHWAVFHNRHGILERLLRCCGGDASLLNMPNKDGETPLSVAVGAGSEVAVKLLLEFGATVM